MTYHQNIERFLLFLVSPHFLGQVTFVLSPALLQDKHAAGFGQSGSMQWLGRACFLFHTPK